MTRRIAFVGRGRVGGSLATAFGATGDEIVAQIGRGDALRVPADADTVIIAVPDDALPGVCDDVLAGLPERALAVHTCGSIGLEPLLPHGERIGVLHPSIPVASSTQPLAGAPFGITGTETSIRSIEGLVDAIGGRAIRIRDEQRIAYHAALVHASNHLVALIADAATMLDEARDALEPLLRATLDNVAAMGPACALTGPVVRGDAGTIAKHLATIPDDLRASYRENARRALALAIASGRLGSDPADAVAAVLDASERSARG